MTQKHTPGPWHLGQDRNYEAALVAENGETVARAAWTGGSGCELEIDKAADARLIAAAPELLEALEAARDTLKAHQMDYADSGYLTAIEDAEAAIARARGETA